MKRLSFILATMTIFVLAGFLLLKTVEAAQTKRQAELAEINNSIANNTNETDKIILLVKSDLLEPSEEKKLQIADLYLKIGEASKADNYLKKIRSKKALIKAAETALETKNEKAINVYLNQIDNPEKEELEIFKAFSEGKIEKITELPKEPQTELGKLLYTINNNTYKDITLNTFLGEKIEALKNSFSGSTKLRLEIARMMVQNNQTEIARFILKQLESDNQTNADFYRVKISSYERDKNYTTALNESKQLIILEPAVQANYLLALSLAEKSQNQVEKEYLQSQITYLQKIQK